MSCIFWWKRIPDGEKAVKALKVVYSHWAFEEISSAELSKIDANAFFGQRISSVNAMYSLCEANQMCKKEKFGS